jgi:prenyltransferase beta subunit
MQRLFLILVVSAIGAAPLGAGELGLKQTIAYVQKLQTPSGGFLPQAPAPNIRAVPTLRSTSAAVRALHYLGADIPDKDACIKYVESCHDAASGGFSDGPKGKPDVYTTAVGLMALAELKMPAEKYAAGAIKFMTEKAKTFEEIRIAAAGLESLKEKSPRAEEWLKEVAKLQNEDGTFGKGPGKARATGGSVVTLVRLGGTPANTNNIVKTLVDGQRQNGGYGKDDEIASDLETTYRVMRCFVMLKARPADTEGIRSFVAKCRNGDGGYGIAPGQPSSVAGTYFAAVITQWQKKNP